MQTANQQEHDASQDQRAAEKDQKLAKIGHDKNDAITGIELNFILLILRGTNAVSRALGRVYYGPVGAPILALQFKNAKLLPSAVAKTSNAFGYPGATPSLSSNGGKNPTVWASENSNPAVLHAYNATTLIELYNSN